MSPNKFSYGMNPNEFFDGCRIMRDVSMDEIQEVITSLSFRLPTKGELAHYILPWFELVKSCPGVSFDGDIWTWSNAESMYSTWGAMNMRGGQWDYFEPDKRLNAVLLPKEETI